MLVSLFPACASSSSNELTIYTALTETIVPPIFEAFTKETGIKVNWIRLSAGETVAKLQAEKANPQASIFFGGSTDNHNACIRDGLLLPYQSPELKNVPEKYQDTINKTWNPIDIGAVAFACNTDWFAKQGLAYPTSWDDLLKPEFKDQVSMAHPGTSGTAYTVLFAMVTMRGEDAAFDYFRELNKNIRQYTKAGAAPAKEVGLGEAAIGLSFDHDILPVAREGYPVVLSFAAEGAPYEIGAVSIIKGGPAKELDNAKKFVDWCVSEKLGNLYGQVGAFMVSCNLNATPPEGAIDVSKLNIVQYDFELAGAERKRLIDKYTEEIMDASNVKE